MTIYAQTAYYPATGGGYANKCMYHSEVGDNLVYSVTLGPCPLPNETGILNAYTQTEPELNLDINDIGDGRVIPWRYGSTVQVSGTFAGELTIQGRDYLGQPMTETITGAGETKKAFKEITLLKAETFTGNLSLGYTKTSGIPFATTSLIEGQYKGLVRTDDLTLVPSVSVHQSVDSGDPRGTVAIGFDYDEGDNVYITAIATDYVDHVYDEGGLYGLPHWFSDATE